MCPLGLFCFSLKVGMEIFAVLSFKLRFVLLVMSVSHSATPDALVCGPWSFYGLVFCGSSLFWGCQFCW